MGNKRIFLFSGKEELGFVGYVLKCFFVSKLIGRNIIRNKVKFCNSFLARN